MTIKESIEKKLGEMVGGSDELLLGFPDSRATDADYFTNVAFVLAKRGGESPREIAPIAANEVKELLNNVVEKVDASANGFVNLWLKEDVLQEEVKRILKRKRKYGSSEAVDDRIQVEFVSANPTGPLTLANGRGGFFGDVLSNVLEFSGARIEREYYVNDTGNQVLILGKSILSSLNLLPPSGEFYQGEYVKEWAEINRSFVEKHKDDPAVVGEKAADHFLELIRNVLEKKAGIRFDRYTSERSLHQGGWVKKALGILEKSGLTYETDGALWFKTTEFGDDKDRVLLTGDKFSTYLLADAGHYLETLKRGFKSKILVLGPDHHGYVKRIRAVSNVLGFKKSDILITQAILVKKGDEFVKMSKRKGEFLTFEDLVDEVGRDIARFFFLMVGTNSHIDFDLKLAKERSSKNPVFYLEYASVRAKKILVKAGQKVRPRKKFLDALATAPERELMFALSLFPDVVKQVARSYEIHRLTKYALDLARTFHNFYERERVIDDAGEKAKLVLVKAASVVFENLFGLLGIIPPEEM